MIAMFLFTPSIKAEPLYTKNCVRCHNATPTKPGTIGPELKSTPENVFYGKITQGIYPVGYKSKRKTKIMPRFKMSKEETDKIVKYIKEFK
jgi:mono/diheme cytochrome c family protein